MAAWEEAFAELVAFARESEPRGLAVSRRSLAVPQGLRGAFYERVGRVQDALAGELLAAGGAEDELGGGVAAPAARTQVGLGASESPVGDAAPVDGRAGDARTGAHEGNEALVGRAAEPGAAGVASAGRTSLPAPTAAELAGIARRCAATRDGLVSAAGLAEFRLASMLEDFLADPLGCVGRPLQRCVVEALQATAPERGARGAVEQGVPVAQATAALREQAAALVAERARMLYRNAYEAWAYCGVVAHLQPRAFYAVGTPDMRAVLAAPTDRVEIAVQPTSPTLRLPEAVFETADGRVFAMKTEAAHELDFYGFRNKRRRDNSAGGNTANLMTHRVLLLWQLPSVDAVDFVADREHLRLTPTALTCEVLAPDEMSVPAYVSAFVERAGAVRSRRPVQVFALGEGGAFPDGMLDDPSVPPVQVRRLDAEGAAFAEVAALLGASVRAA